MSTIKQSRNTGNIFISQIDIDSNKITLTLSNKEKLFLSSSNYVNYYLYKDKILEQGEYLKLKEESNSFEVLNYLYKLINYKPYSKKQLVDKVNQKYEIPKDKIYKLIDNLIENGQYNPSIFLNEYVSKLLRKGYAFSKIVKELENENYSYKEIENSINENKDNFNIENLINEIIRKNSQKNIFLIKQAVINKLTILGHSNQDINNYLQKYFYINPTIEKLNEQEVYKLKNELIKTYNNYKLRNLDEYTLKSKCINKMISKGYKIDDIKKEYEEIKNAN